LQSSIPETKAFYMYVYVDICVHVYISCRNLFREKLLSDFLTLVANNTGLQIGGGTWKLFDNLETFPK